MQEDAEKLFQEKRKDLIAPQILNRAYNTSNTYLQTLLNHERKTTLSESRERGEGRLSCCVAARERSGEQHYFHWRKFAKKRNQKSKNRK